MDAEPCGGLLDRQHLVEGGSLVGFGEDQDGGRGGLAGDLQEVVEAIFDHLVTSSDRSAASPGTLGH
ncbi:hypothetical protein [Lacipirellula parvula]|uniref:Uncharacterized protein n=1 Tax=Lacipirellula parvula TaxID=2650471 RepID=A0A5K7XJB0_9BACT|nr:hypothetical protein [Lacipirellula parvula]BBO34476.1 hypothetical protein PLANPX_4088 [Lacipirellula parvula]